MSGVACLAEARSRVRRAKAGVPTGNRGFVETFHPRKAVPAHLSQATGSVRPADLALLGTLATGLANSFTLGLGIIGNIYENPELLAN